jgi:hypothetical protein
MAETSSGGTGKLIALVAIVVTGIVGVWAPWVTTRSSERAVRQGIAADRAQSDRAEARGVLDQVAEDLRHVEFTLSEWSPRAYYPQTAPRRILLRLEAAREALLRDEARLTIRFGTKAPTTAACASAARTVQLARLLSQANGEFRRRHSGRSYYLRYLGFEKAYNDAAYKLVGAALK